MKTIKSKKIIAVFAAALLTGCNNEPTAPAKTTAMEDTAKPVENKIMIPDKLCYSTLTGKDTVFLTLEKFPNVVTGNLTYKLYGKDKNTGDIDGKLNGDTLIADYKFMSEGKQSNRQLVFLLNDSIAKEGYGPMEEIDGKMVFKKLNEIDFKKGIKLYKLPCPVQ